MVANEPLAGASPELPAQADDALPEPEPLELDLDQEAMREAVEEAERVAEEEAEASEVSLPEGALDGTAGSDLFGEDGPPGMTVLTPNEEGGGVYPPLTDQGMAGDAVVVDDGSSEDVSEPLPPDQLTEALQETSESLAERGETGDLVEAAQELDESDLEGLEPGDEVVDLRTVDSRTFLEEDGTFRTELGSERMFAETAGGELVEPNPRPRGSRDERWRPTAGRPGTSFGPDAQDDALGSMSFGEGRSISWGLDDARRVAAERHGQRVVYDDVLEGVDLEMESTLTGVKETIVITDPDAPLVYDFPLDLTGLEAKLEDPYGSVVLVDQESGEPVGVIPSAWAQDSAPGLPGETPDPSPVAYELVGDGADAALRVKVDEEWFGDPARILPVVVDPSVGEFKASGDTWVHSSSPSTNFSTFPVLKSGGGTGNKRTYFARWDIGWLVSATILDARYGSFNSYSYSCNPRWFGVYRVTSNWNPATVTWNTQPSYSTLLSAANASYGYSSSCPANWFYTGMRDVVQRWVDGRYPAYGVTGRVAPFDNYNDSYTYKEFLPSESGGNGGQVLQVTWSPWRVQYAYAGGYVEPTATQAGSIKIRVTNKAPTTWRRSGTNRYRLGYHVYKADGTTLVTWNGGQVDLPQDVSWGESVVVTVPLAPRAVGEYQYKFDMLQSGVRWFSQEADHPDLRPLAIRVSVGNTPPYIEHASPAGQVETRAPTLQVKGVNPDNYPSGGLQYRFVICEEPWTDGVCVWSTWQSADRWAPDHLVWGKSYQWNAQVRETGSGALTTNPEWIAPLVPTLVQPRVEKHFGSDPYAPLHMGVNPSIGNYVASFTDVQVASAGLPVELTRTYNSMDTRVGAFGPGWSTALDLYAESEEGGKLLVSFPDGHQERYGQNPDGSWASPPGNASVLRSVDGGGWELQRPDRTTYVFNPDGLPIAIRDGYGLELTLTRTDGRVTKVTNQVSGRFMELTWEPVGPEGAQVITKAKTNAPATGEPAPEWTYSYGTAGRLAGVCAPGEPEANAQCTQYVYYSEGRGAEGKLRSITRQEGNVAVELGYQPDGAVAWVENGTNDRWVFTDNDDTAEGTYHPVAGWRAGETTVGANATTTVDVTGSGGVPDAGVQAVVVDVEAGALSSGWFSLYPSGMTEPPSVSTMSYMPGNRSTLQTVAVGDDGKIVLSNHGSGDAVVNFDVVGWYAKAGVTNQGSVFVPVPTARILDTRVSGQGPALSAGSVRSVQVTGQGGIPNDGVTAVVFDLEMVAASELTRLTAYASGTSRPTGISTAVTAGSLVDNLHISAVGADGKINIHNMAGSVHVLVDVVGYFADPDLHEGNVFRPVTNQRLLDSRNSDGQWSTPWPAGGTRPITVAGEGTLPARGVTAVVGEVQSVGHSATHTMRSGPSGETNAGTTYIAQASQTVGNHMYSGVGGNGAFDLYSQQAADVVVDIVGYFTPIPRTTYAQDPRGSTVEYRYDNLGRLTGRIDEDGYETAWAYNEAGFLSSTQGPTVDGHRYEYDDEGHLIADSLVRTWSAAADWLESTTYYGYVDDAANPARDGKLAWVADGRSADVDDTSYRTTYTYDDHGQPLTVRGPALPDAPSGVGTTRTYAAGAAQPAPCPAEFGIAPQGLMQTEADAAGLMTTYCYDTKGDLREVHHPSGLVDKYTYDGLGRARTHTQISDSYPAGVTTTRGYDAKGRIVREIGPRVTIAIDGLPDGQYHRAQSDSTYTPNGNTRRVTVSDTETGDARWMEYSYDPSDRFVGTVDNAGRTTARTYDANGNVATETGTDGLTMTYEYNKRNLLDSTTAKNVVVDPIDAPDVARDVRLMSYIYLWDRKPIGTIDVSGTWIRHNWSPHGLPLDTWTYTRNGADQVDRRILLSSNRYDKVGNLISTFASTDSSYTNEFAGSELDAGWQTSGSWSVTDGELTAGSVGALAWREGAADGEVRFTVGGSAPATVLFRVQDPQNYFGVRWEGSTLSVIWVVDGDERILGEYSGTAPAEGGYFGASFTGHRLQVVRADASSVSTLLPIIIPDNIPGTGIGVLATDVGQAAEKLEFNGFLRTENTFDAYGRQVASTVDPGGQDIRRETSLLPDGRPSAVYVSSATNPTETAETRYAYDQESALLASTTELIADPNREIDGDETLASTAYTHDQRGLVTRMVSPEGAQFDYAYDEVGQLVSATGPARTVEGYGQPAQPGVRPVESYAYTAFGERRAIEDPAGRQTTVSYDDRGFPVQVRSPSYTPPGSSTPVERTISATYDDAGRVLSETDPTGATTSYTYNTLGHLVARTEPAGGGDPAGVWRFVHDSRGLLREQRDPTGAVVRQQWDFLRRLTAVEEIVRQPELKTNVTAFELGDAGGVLRSTTAEGVVTTNAYDPVSRLVETADAGGNTTSYRYDGLGRLAQVTTPDGRQMRNGYDLVGQTTSEQLYAADGSLLGEARHRYDLDGRLVETWSPRGPTKGFSTNYTYDAAGQAMSRTTPVAPGQAIAETWGYDELGQAVRYTDGRNNTTWQTYNSMGLPEDAIEPAAGSHTAVTDRRWRSVYDAAGRPVTQQAPGGVTVTSRYDELGRLIEQAGTGGQAQTATRSFDYDPVGRLVLASTPEGSQSFTYDDRGLLLTSTGVSGDSSFIYDGDGRVTRRTDSSGVTDFTYDDRGLPDAMTSSLSGTVSFDFDESGRPTTVDYGNNTTRTYRYDAWGRLDIDTLATGSNVLYRADYGYDADGNIVSKNITGADVPAAGLNQYDYDWASRITSWTNPGGAVEAYQWDAASNRIRAGDTTTVYDEQNRLVRTEGPGGLVTNTWLANGTLDKTQTRRRVSLVVADPASLTQAESALVWGLSSWGAAVSLVDDASAMPVDGVDVFVISPDVDPAAVADKYKTVAEPVVSLAAGTWQATGLTNTAPTTQSATSASVAAPEHEVAAGKTGTVTLLTSSDDISSAAAASLGSGATTVWTTSSTSTDAIAAAYDTGDATADGGTAVARRVMVGFSAGAVTKLTADGAELVKAAVAWADDNDATFGTTNFDFDAFEQLNRITTPNGDIVNNSYDPIGRRLTSPTGALTYSGAAIRPSTDGAHRYQPGPTAIIAIDDTDDGGGRWANADHHTDVVGAFTPGATNLTGAQTFSPWGEPLDATGDPLPLGYQSERLDLPGGLIGMGVREYNPQTSTFISHDPVADPAVPNGYSYTSANPLGGTDPTGRYYCTTPASCAAAAAAAAVNVVVGGSLLAPGKGPRGLRPQPDARAAGRALAYESARRARSNRAAAARYQGQADRYAGYGAGLVGEEFIDQYLTDGPSGRPGSRADRQLRGSNRSAIGRPNPPPPPPPPPPFRTPTSMLRNGPTVAFADSPVADQIRSTGSAVPNYPSRYQTDTTGQRIDTGNASIPTTAVVPTSEEDPRQAAPPTPEIVIEISDGLSESPAGVPGDPSLGRIRMRVGDDECGYAQGRGDVGWGREADVIWSPDPYTGCSGIGGTGSVPGGQRDDASRSPRAIGPAGNPGALPDVKPWEPNVGGSVHSSVTEIDEIYYRVSGPTGAETGAFLTRTRPRSPEWAREALALPPGNDASLIQEVLVPAGTRYQRSRARPAFGQRGGGEQFELLERIPRANFGPRVPWR